MNCSEEYNVVILRQLLLKTNLSLNQFNCFCKSSKGWNSWNITVWWWGSEVVESMLQFSGSVIKQFWLRQVCCFMYKQYIPLHVKILEFYFYQMPYQGNIFFKLWKIQVKIVMGKILEIWIFFQIFDTNHRSHLTIFSVSMHVFTVI